MTRQHLSKTDNAAQDEATLEEHVASFLADMHRINRSIAQLINPALEREFDIDGRLYFMLMQIEAGDIHPGALAETMRLPKSLISRHIDQLTKKGLIVRQVEAGDSRRIRLVLTKSGRQVLAAARVLAASLVGGHLKRIPAKEREIVLGALGNLARYME